MINIILILIALGGGIAVGTALSAFLAILQIIPRLLQLTNTNNYIRLYYWTIIISTTIFNVLYLFDYSISINKYITIIIGLIYGVFIGLLSSALAEVLNVMPILAKKFKIKDNLKYTIYALMFGKVIGSFYYFIFHL